MTSRDYHKSALKSKIEGKIQPKREKSRKKEKRIFLGAESVTGVK